MDPQHCIDAIHLGWFRGLGGLGAVFLGACLAALWIADGVFFAVCARVVRFGEPIGFVAPAQEIRGDMATRSKLLRRFRACGAGFLLAGGIVFLLTLSPVGFSAVFGPRGILASNLLALSLLAHVPAFSVLSRVFKSSRPFFMLHPTEASRRSLTPAYAAAFAALFCLVAGVAIIITQDALPPAGSVWPHLFSLSGMDWHGLLLAAMLFVDALVLLRISDVQLTGEPQLCLRPLPEVDEHQLGDLGEALAAVSGGLQGLCTMALWLAFCPSLCAALFGTMRVLPLLWELVLALHAVGLFGLGYLFRRGLAIGVFEPPSPRDAPEAALFSTERMPSTLQYAAAGCAALSYLLPLIDGGYWWETTGNVLFTILVGSVPLTHGLYTRAPVHLPCISPASHPHLGGISAGAAHPRPLHGGRRRRGIRPRPAGAPPRLLCGVGAGGPADGLGVHARPLDLRQGHARVPHLLARAVPPHRRPGRLRPHQHTAHRRSHGDVVHGRQLLRVRQGGCTVRQGPAPVRPGTAPRGGDVRAAGGRPLDDRRLRHRPVGGLLRHVQPCRGAARCGRDVLALVWHRWADGQRREHPLPGRG